MQDNHYDRTADADDYYGRQSQEAQTPSSELTDFLTSWFHQQVVGFQQVVESNNTPLSPPEPSTASIPAPGLEAAKLLASVQGVNSTPLQECLARLRTATRQTQNIETTKTHLLQLLNGDAFIQCVALGPGIFPTAQPCIRCCSGSTAHTHVHTILDT